MLKKHFLTMLKTVAVFFFACLFFVETAMHLFEIEIFFETKKHKKKPL